MVNRKLNAGRDFTSGIKVQASSILALPDCAYATSLRLSPAKRRRVGECSVVHAHR